MKTLQLKIIIHCFLILMLMLVSSPNIKATTKHAESNQKDVFKAGAASVNITPPVGSIMGNSYGITVAEGVHDDLFAKALVFETGEDRAVLIALDLISIPHQIVIRTRELVEEKTGIPAKNILMTATHVHAGPQLNPLFWEVVGGVPKQKSKEYARKLPEMIAKSVQMAVSKLHPVKISVGKIQEKTINFNRRFLMKDGSFKMNPGQLNENSVRPVGPVDPDLSVIKIETMDSKPVAFMVNFALHVAVVGGTHFSADFPSTVSSLLAQVYGEDVVTIFTNSTSGNVNHVDVMQTEQLENYSESQRIGTILAANVMKVIPALRPIEPERLQVESLEVELPVPAVNENETDWAQRVINNMGQPEPPPFSDVVQAWRIMDLTQHGNNEERHNLTTTVPLTQDGKALKSEVQVITLGKEIALVGFPGDAFAELGLAIKLHSPFPFTVINEQSGNGTISYVPNRKAFSEGGYEVISARYSPGGGEILVEAVNKLLIELYPYRSK